MKIQRWGDGLAMPIPDDIVRRFDIKPGDDVDFSIEDGQVLMTVRPDQDAVKLMITRMKENRRPFPADYKFDRAEAYGFEEE